MKQRNIQFVLLMLSLLNASSMHAEQSTNERLDILVGRAAKPAQVHTAANAGLVSSDTSVTADSSDDREDIDGEALPKPKPFTLRDQAFKDLLDKISPLTPEQIIEMRRQQDRTQRAVAAPVEPPPRPVSSTLIIDLSPGATPPVIRLGFGFVTSLVFVDSTGQSWPISDYNLGNPKGFNIQWDKKTNTLFVQSTTMYNTGNLALRLATLDTPVMISLVSGQREVDYRVDVQVPGRGPNASTAIVGDNLPSGPNPFLLSVLDGVPPAGSQEIEVSGGYGRAWLHKGKLIFRTRQAILSPAWSATVSSLDGTHVYEMNPTPLIIVSQNGKPMKIVLRGF
jgi:intracellular multiplication protein IcmK